MHPSSCHGTGKVTCRVCDGAGKLRHFKLNVRTHENLITEEVADSLDHDTDAGVPIDVVGTASGRNILDYTAVNIAPPQGFSDLVDSCLTKTNITAHEKVMNKNGLQHQERLIMRMIPIYQSSVKYKDQPFHFYVLGDPEAHGPNHSSEYVVHSGDYPHQACCCFAKNSCLCC